MQAVSVRTFLRCVPSIILEYNLADMGDYKTVTVKEETWHGLRILVRESDHESQHQFVKSAVVEYARQNDLPMPRSLLREMEQKEPEPVEW